MVHLTRELIVDLELLTCDGKPVPQVAKSFKFKLPARATHLRWKARATSC